MTLNPGAFTANPVETPKTVTRAHMFHVHKRGTVDTVVAYIDLISPANSTEVIQRPRQWRMSAIDGISLEAYWVSLKMRNGRTVSVYAKDRDEAQEFYNILEASM